MASSARIDELRKKFDENPRRYFAPLANEYRKAGDAEQAIFICQEYLPQQPGHMSGHIVYGQALYELNRSDEARAVFETALSLDPENLIALRHLGDIARESGDTDTARVWYQRVLEADPRNEEIAQIMLSLLSSEAGAASGAANVGEAGHLDSALPTPLTSPVVVSGDEPSPQVAEPPRYELNASAPAGEDRAGVADELRPLSPHAPKEADLLDLDDFDLGGIPLSELRAANPTPIYQPAQPFDESTASGIDLPPMIGADDAGPAGANLESSHPDADAATDEREDAAFASEQSEFEADPYAVASASFDNDVGSDDDSLTSPPLDAPPESATDFATESPASADESIESAFSSAFDSASDSPNAGEGDESSAFVPGFATAVVGDGSEAASDAPAEPPIELATDLHLGLENDDPADMIAPSPTAAMDGLETFEPGVFTAEPTAADFIETESFFETTPASPSGEMHEPKLSEEGNPADREFVADGFGDGESSSDAAAAEPTAAPVEAFVTETMAELYLEQGHLESALDIYQRLVDQRPEDPALFTRMQAVQDRVEAAGETAVASPADADVAPARSYGGPTIREFLSGLARKSPGYSGAAAEASYSDGESGGSNLTDPYARDAYAGDDFAAYVGTPAPYDGIDEPFNTDAPFVDRSIETSLEEFGPHDEANGIDADAGSRTATSAGSTVGGSLGELFSGADAAASDTEAANMLAAAFASEGPETAALEGLPAHRAASELSLDHVFRGNTTPRPAGDTDGFSFDQFFADEATDGAAETSGDAAPSAAQGADDIAQFNAWLNGLKKT